VILDHCCPHITLLFLHCYLFPHSCYLLLLYIVTLVIYDYTHSCLVPLPRCYVVTLRLPLLGHAVVVTLHIRCTHTLRWFTLRDVTLRCIIPCVCLLLLLQLILRYVTLHTFTHTFVARFVVAHSDTLRYVAARTRLRILPFAFTYVHHIALHGCVPLWVRCFRIYVLLRLLHCSSTPGSSCLVVILPFGCGFCGWFGSFYYICGCRSVGYSLPRSRLHRVTHTFGSSLRSARFDPTPAILVVATRAVTRIAGCVTPFTHILRSVAVYVWLILVRCCSLRLALHVLHFVTRAFTTPDGLLPAALPAFAQHAVTRLRWLRWVRCRAHVTAFLPYTVRFTRFFAFFCSLPLILRFMRLWDFVTHSSFCTHPY